MISSTATLACSDVEETLHYYKSVLGFENTVKWGEPANFGMATSGGATVTFALQPELVAKITGLLHGFRVDDVDMLFEIHRSNGAKVVAEPQDMPWGVREYVVEDLNGYLLHFSGVPKRAERKSEPLPNDVHVELRLPTYEEFLQVAGVVFGDESLSCNTLSLSWMGVVAKNQDDEAVGLLRIVRDSEDWFSIWDVAVLPDWQYKNIGTLMMNEALRLIREASPNAVVHLFTHQHGFYERFGFVKESVSICRM